MWSWIKPKQESDHFAQSFYILYIMFNKLQIDQNMSYWFYQQGIQIDFYKINYVIILFSSIIDLVRKTIIQTNRE